MSFAPSVAAAITAVLIALPAAAQQQQQQQQTGAGEQARTGTIATADLMNAEEKRIGTAAIVETPTGILIQLDIPEGSGLQTGLHGVHIHETGECTPPNFQSAGGHFNPEGREHGFLSPNGPHAGDLPNVWVHENGAARADLLTDRVTAGEGNTGLFKQGGTALVVHAGPDDYTTNPSGESGDRVACGVIRVP